MGNANESSVIPKSHLKKIVSHTLEKSGTIGERKFMLSDTEV
jgi:hypothetical protein